VEQLETQVLAVRQVEHILAVALVALVELVMLVGDKMALQAVVEQEDILEMVEQAVLLLLVRVLL
jgi:hypothetical protein